MNPYKVRQLDAEGEVLSEERVTANNYNAALRVLNDVSEGAQRIEVFNDEGEKAGEISVEYWRQKVRRKW